MSFEEAQYLIGDDYHEHRDFKRRGHSSSGEAKDLYVHERGDFFHSDPRQRIDHLALAGHRRPC